MNYENVRSYFGSDAAAGKRLGLSRQAVHKWKSTGIDPMRQLYIERVTQGALKADPIRVVQEV